MTGYSRTQRCPSCGVKVTMIPYDIGSGPEMSCPHCEWCWGADGQDLKPISELVDRNFPHPDATTFSLYLDPPSRPPKGPPS